MAITHISFDHDGTLELEKFDKIVWNEEIPKLYSEKNNISLDDAKRIVYAEYEKAKSVEHIKNWTDISYWFDRLGLTNWEECLEDMKHHVLLYDDTIEVLEELSKKYTLIIVSSADRRFLHLKFASTGIEKYFFKVFSSASDYGLWRKDRTVYTLVLKELHLQPQQVVHIGDSQAMDVDEPTSVGMHALLIDRTGKKKGNNIIHSLSEIHGKIKEMK